MKNLLKACQRWSFVIFGILTLLLAILLVPLALGYASVAGYPAPFWFGLYGLLVGIGATCVVSAISVMEIERTAKRLKFLQRRTLKRIGEQRSQIEALQTEVRQLTEAIGKQPNPDEVQDQHADQQATPPNETEDTV